MSDEPQEPDALEGMEPMPPLSVDEGLLDEPEEDDSLPDIGVDEDDE